MIEHWAFVGAAGGGPKAPVALRRQALGLVIWWDWIVEEATKVGVKVSASEVHKQYEIFTFEHIEGVSLHRFKNESKLSELVFSSRTKYADRQYLVRMELLAAALERWRTAQARKGVSHAQVVAYYERNRESFVRPERRDIEAVMNLSKGKLEQARRELESGARFSTVAERFNVSVEGGLKLGITRGHGKKRFERDFFAAPAHVFVGPVKEILSYIFKVLKIWPRRQETLAQSEARIKEHLASEAASTTLLRTFEQEWVAKTSCRQGYIVPRCSQYK
ncbi:MAG: peptidyl-prolyl cis-trans isomerase [Phenylobacterium sp.]|nr:MAG: peptidyl-prolyl cis-trans isomerase [Phenylobacterium sp.]